MSNPTRLKIIFYKALAFPTLFIISTSAIIMTLFSFSLWLVVAILKKAITILIPVKSSNKKEPITEINKTSIQNAA